MDWNSIGTQAAGGVIGAGMGMLMEGHNDRRQREQQAKLQAMQIQGQKEMMDYSQQKQLEMWDKTNYSAQVDQLNKAGLNAALLYGQGGGGGATTGSAQGSVTGGVAPSGGGEAMGMMMKGLEIQNMQAQKEVMESQANKNNAEAESIEQKREGEVETIWQGLDNLRGTHDLQKLDITMKNIQNFEQQASQDDRLAYIEYQTKIAEKQLGLLKNQGKISDETVQDNIKQIKAESVGAVLQNVLTRSKTGLTDAQTENTKGETWLQSWKAKGIDAAIQQGWQGMSQKEKEIWIKDQLKTHATDPNREAIQQGIGALNVILSRKSGSTIINSYERHE